MGEKFYKVDLHVHTPASSCYLGDKNESEYYKILESARLKGLHAIAITDHNSISGYERFICLRKDLETKLSLFESINEKNEEINEGIKDTKAKLDLFNQVKLFAGIELTLNPGIHLIIISDDNDTTFFNTLLNKIGYDEHARGDEKRLPTYDVLRLLGLNEIEDKIVFAPHIDSDKGILAHLEGEYRASVFSSDNLHAVSCNNKKTAKKLETDILTQPQYKRKGPLGYINASDAHETKDIGAKVSYFKMKKCKFSELKKSINSPETCISNLANPEVKNFVDNILESPHSVVALPEIESIAKAVCACLNERFGYIVLGVEWPKKDLIGIKESQEEFDGIFKNALVKIEFNGRFTAHAGEPYILGSGNKVYIIVVQSYASVIWNIKDTLEVYFIDVERNVRIASIKEIEQKSQENILLALRKLEKQQELQIERIQNSLCLIGRSVTRVEIFYKIKRLGVPLLTIAKPEFISRKQTSGYEFYNQITNNDEIGMPTGNAYVLYDQTPRLEYAYLRCTCPCLGEIDIKSLEQSGTLRRNDESIIISQKGGVHIIDVSDWFICLENDALIISKIKDQSISMYALCAWLKSSLFLFYLLQENGSVSIFPKQNAAAIMVPLLDKKNHLVRERIDEKVKAIILQEKTFLEEYCKFEYDYNRSDEIEQKKQNEQRTQMIDQHNEKIDFLAKEIDNMFYEYFQITQGQIDCINKTLKAEGVYNL